MNHSPEGFDCRACAACCRARPGTILVLQQDIVRWKRAGRSDLVNQLIPGHFGEMAYAVQASGACVHLGVPGAPNDCSIYEERGTICREFEPGNPQCVSARRAQGIGL